MEGALPVSSSPRICSPPILTGSEVFHPRMRASCFNPAPVQPPGAGGRDQPGAGQGAVRPAGGHGRAPDHRGQEELAPALPFSWQPPPRTPSSRKGPHPLPEAQLDRFCSSCWWITPAPPWSWPSFNSTPAATPLPTPLVTLSQSDLLEARTAVQGYRCRALEHYLVQLVLRHPPRQRPVPLSWNPSLRWCQPQSQHRPRKSRTGPALLAGRDFFLARRHPATGPAVLRHRLIPELSGAGGQPDSEASSPCCCHAVHALNRPPQAAPVMTPPPSPGITPDIALTLERLLAVRSPGRARASVPAFTGGRPGRGRAPAWLHFRELAHQAGDEVRHIDWRVTARPAAPTPASTGRAGSGPLAAADLTRHVLWLPRPAQGPPWLVSWLPCSQCRGETGHPLISPGRSPPQSTSAALSCLCWKRSVQT